MRPSRGISIKSPGQKQTYGRMKEDKTAVANSKSIVALNTEALSKV